MKDLCLYKYLHETSKVVSIWGLGTKRKEGWLKQCIVCRKVVFVGKLVKPMQMPDKIYYDGSTHLEAKR